MSQRETLVRDNVCILEQGIRLLESLDDETYARAEPRLGSSGIGCHVRHCVEFFDRLLAGLATGRIDYDGRERDARVELERAYAIERMHAVIRGLRALDAGANDRELRVRMDASSDAAGAVPWCASSLDRELQSLMSHTVHHYALVAMLLRLAGHEPEASFGVAPSTLRHREEEARACAP